MTESEKVKKQMEYDEMVKKASPNSPIFTDCLKAFISGGLICVIGQLMRNYFTGIGLSQDDTGLAVSLILIATTVLLTGFGLFGKIGKFCGAGTIVPITGFANSIASPAIEFKKEGWIFGLGAKMFQVAGPVIVYGTVTSMFVGLIYYIMGLVR
ncbi:MAG: stage V sporulation protein AC [Candidatus Metalachnospira sp.]|nr:stage V sporulation protein AC [Candidatus Metalachnospira sp.]